MTTLHGLAQDALYLYPYGMVRVKGLNLRSPTDAKVSGRQQCAYQDLERWNLQQVKDMRLSIDR